MTDLPDLRTPEDVRTLVDFFYDKVVQDELLAPVFDDFAKVDRATHLQSMYRFWESMLFGAGTCEGAPLLASRHILQVSRVEPDPTKRSPE